MADKIVRILELFEDDRWLKRTPIFIHRGKFDLILMIRNEGEGQRKSKNESTSIGMRATAAPISASY